MLNNNQRISMKIVLVEFTGDDGVTEADAFQTIDSFLDSVEDLYSSEDFIDLKSQIDSHSNKKIVNVRVDSEDCFHTYRLVNGYKVN